MKRSKYSEDHAVYALRQTESGTPGATFVGSWR